MNKFFIGSSYYPEWWSEEQWEYDFSKMQELGFNTVRMGEFAWSWYEPKEGEYNFEPMKKAVKCAENHGISVVMGTPTAVVPAWLYKKYPEVKGGNEHGHYTFGGRKGQCLSSDIFLSYAEKIVTEQAKALSECKNIIGWQLDNEPGFPFWEFDENCTKGFRAFLKEKYTTIENLNKAWFTAMWSNDYTSFDEIDIPSNASEGGWSPQVQLDYRRYFSFMFNRLLSMEAGIIRKYSPNTFLYTNWPGANWSVNCFEGSNYLDYAAWDNYVPQPNGENYRIQLRASMEHSFDRRLSNGKNTFLVAEQHAYTDINTKPEVMAAQTFLNVSHGAFATIFFEWLSPTGGYEQGYNGVVGRNRDFRDETKPVFEKLCKDIDKIYPDICGAKTVSETAAVYSYESSWGSRGWVVDGPYDEEFFNIYGGFKNELKQNIDIAGIDDDLTAYKMLLIPSHTIMTQEQAEKLKTYVKNGGIIVINPICGTKQVTNQMRELLYPGLLCEIAGCNLDGEMYRDKFEEQTQKECIVILGDTETKAGKTIYKFIDSSLGKDTKIIGKYKNGLLADKAAAVINKYGNGYCVTVAASDCDIYYYEALAKLLKKEFNIKPILNVTDGIIVSSREKEGKIFAFAVNMKDSVGKVVFDKACYDLLNDKNVGGEVTLSPYETGIYLIK